MLKVSHSRSRAVVALQGSERLVTYGVRGCASKASLQVPGAITAQPDKAAEQNNLRKLKVKGIGAGSARPYAPEYSARLHATACPRWHGKVHLISGFVKQHFVCKECASCASIAFHS
jgi:hypothetical protein